MPKLRQRRRCVRGSEGGGIMYALTGRGILGLGGGRMAPYATWDCRCSMGDDKGAERLIV